MRLAKYSIITLGLILLGATASPRGLACGDDDVRTIKIPGTPYYGRLHGDLFLCVCDKDRLLAVDLKREKVTELGSARKRWYDGDVRDGRLLMIEQDKIREVALDAGKTLREITLADPQVRAFGFAGKDRVFVHRGNAVEILDLDSAKVVHRIELAKEGWTHAATPWQRIGHRLITPGPATTLCIIDLDAGTLVERFSVDARNGITNLYVEGGVAFCSGSPFAWGARTDHITSVDLETGKNRIVDVQAQTRGAIRFARGPFGNVYLMSQKRIDRVNVEGELLASVNVDPNQQPLGIWRQKLLVAGKNEIRLVDITETRVARR